MKNINRVESEAIKYYRRIKDILVLSKISLLNKSFWAKKKEIILILQMGKVSSSSIYATIRKESSLAVFQFHRSAFNFRRFTSRRFTGSPIRKAYLIIRSIPHELTGALIKKRMDNFGIPVKFIVTVREPVSRNISAYFHNRKRFSGQEAMEKGSATDRARQTFLRSYPHAIPLSWFDTELRPLTGVDVFSYPFDRESGYCILKSDRHDILLMHHDLTERNMLKAINEFLGTELKKVVRDNVGVDKKYASEYNEFKSSAKLPKSYVLDMLNSRYARHFFSTEYRRKVARSWADEEIDANDLHEKQDA